MDLYNFDIINKTITGYYIDYSYVKTADLHQPLLDFVNCDFSEYDILRRRIHRFIQKYEQKFENMDSDEIEKEIKKDFPDFKCSDIDNGEVWWIAELSNYLYLHSPYFPFFFVSELNKNSVQSKSNFDYLYWQSQIRNKVETIFDIDNPNFIEDFPPICRLNYFYGESFTFKEITIVHPSNFECLTGNYEDFAIPFHTFDEDPVQAKLSDDEYKEKEAERQKFIKEHLQIVNGYEFHSLEDAFDCEILKMAQIGMTLRRCPNCGKYFVFNPNKPARYCTNKQPNVNMTCQQIAAQRKYNQTVSPIQKAYTNALKNRNKWYPSKKSGLRTPEQAQEYENWKKKKSQIRDEFQQKYDNAPTDLLKEQILEEFKRALLL